MPTIGTTHLLFSKLMDSVGESIIIDFNRESDSTFATALEKSL